MIKVDKCLNYHLTDFLLGSEEFFQSNTVEYFETYTSRLNSKDGMLYLYDGEECRNQVGEGIPILNFNSRVGYVNNYFFTNILSKGILET